MRPVLTLMMFLFSIFVFSQEKELIESLENRKDELKSKIEIIQDSIKQINIKIAKIESEEFLKKINDSTYTAIAKKGAKIRKNQTPFSEIITVFEIEKKVILIDYNNGIFKVCSNSICGFMNEVWIKPNQKIAYLIKQRNKTNKLLSNQKTESSNHRASLSSNSTNSSLNKKTKKSNNSYYKHKTYKISRSYIRGPRGGCYYINSNGNKTYVDRSFCN